MKINTESETWKDLEKYLKDEMEKTIKILLNENMGIKQTQYFRGYHQALNSVLNLPNKQERKTKQSTTY